jgi:prepilin-type N-terminal cleavage/methylation domain-containing protein
VLYGTNKIRGKMKIHSSNTQRRIGGEQDDKGFTLIEILIAIVLVGILSAVAVVGISNLVSKGGTSACQASADSAKAGSTVYFASATRYPVDFLELTAAGTTGAPMTLPSGVTGPGTAAIAAGTTSVHSGTSWTLTMTAGSSGAAPTFACS